MRVAGILETYRYRRANHVTGTGRVNMFLFVSYERVNIVEINLSWFFSLIFCIFPYESFRKKKSQIDE